MRRSRLPAVLIAAALLPAVSFPPPAAASDNVPGRWTENRIVGFRFRPMNEWAEIPQGTDPEDPRIGGYYCDRAKRGPRPECGVYAFKRSNSRAVATESGAGGEEPGTPPEPREPTREEILRALRAQNYRKSTRETVERLRGQYYEFAEQVMARLDEREQRKIKGRDWRAEPTEKEFDAGDARGTLIDAPVALVDRTSGKIEGARVLAAFIVNEEYEAGLVYIVPEDDLRKYGRGIAASLTSLRWMDPEEIAAAREDLAEALSGAATADERWLAELKSRIGAGWDWFQTRNYLLIFDREVEKDRVRAIALQIEAIRKDVYEVVFPPDRPVTTISVVRICKDKPQYHQYGGPDGSAGYWNSGSRELVFYEDKGAKKDSLRVLNHEAFHQYIFYSVGSIAPHSWFNEGHGDYFAGFELNRRGRFEAEKFAWRRSIIKNAMATDSYVPLKEFVAYSQGQYYSRASLCYAQGWALVWFLRQQRNPRWDGILTKYFDALKGVVTGWVDEQIAARKEAGEYEEGWTPSIPPDVQERARQKALEAAFGDFDEETWKRFDKEWKDFKY